MSELNLALFPSVRRLNVFEIASCQGEPVPEGSLNLLGVSDDGSLLFVAVKRRILIYSLNDSFLNEVACSRDPCHRIVVPRDAGQVNALRIGRIAGKPVLLVVTHGAQLRLYFYLEKEGLNAPIILSNICCFDDDSSWSVCAHPDSAVVAIGSNAHVISIFNLVEAKFKYDELDVSQDIIQRATERAIATRWSRAMERLLWLDEMARQPTADIPEMSFTRNALHLLQRIHRGISESNGIDSRLSFEGEHNNVQRSVPDIQINPYADLTSMFQLQSMLPPNDPPIEPQIGVQRLIGHRNNIPSVEFAPIPGSPFIASASIDQTIRVWSVPDGQCIGGLRTHNWCWATSWVKKKNTVSVNFIDALEIPSLLKLCLSGDVGMNYSSALRCSKADRHSLLSRLFKQRDINKSDNLLLIKSAHILLDQLDLSLNVSKIISDICLRSDIYDISGILTYNQFCRPSPISKPFKYRFGYSTESSLLTLLLERTGLPRPLTLKEMEHYKDLYHNQVIINLLHCIDWASFLNVLSPDLLTTWFKQFPRISGRNCQSDPYPAPPAQLLPLCCFALQSAISAAISIKTQCPYPELPHNVINSSSEWGINEDPLWSSHDLFELVNNQKEKIIQNDTNQTFIMSINGYDDTVKLFIAILLRMTLSLSSRNKFLKMCINKLSIMKSKECIDAARYELLTEITNNGTIPSCLPYSQLTNLMTLIVYDLYRIRDMSSDLIFASFSENSFVSVTLCHTKLSIATIGFLYHGIRVYTAVLHDLENGWKSASDNLLLYIELLQYYYTNKLMVHNHDHLNIINSSVSNDQIMIVIEHQSDIETYLETLCVTKCILLGRLLSYLTNIITLSRVYLSIILCDSLLILPNKQDKVSKHPAFMMQLHTRATIPSLFSIWNKKFSGFGEQHSPYFFYFDKYHLIRAIPLPLSDTDSLGWVPTISKRLHHQQGIIRDGLINNHLLSSYYLSVSISETEQVYPVISSAVMAFNGLTYDIRRIELRNVWKSRPLYPNGINTTIQPHHNKQLNELLLIGTSQTGIHLIRFETFQLQTYSSSIRTVDQEDLNQQDPIDNAKKHDPITIHPTPLIHQEKYSVISIGEADISHLGIWADYREPIPGLGLHRLCYLLCCHHCSVIIVASQRTLPVALYRIVQCIHTKRYFFKGLFLLGEPIHNSTHIINGQQSIIQHPVVCQPSLKEINKKTMIHYIIHNPVKLSVHLHTLNDSQNQELLHSQSSSSSTDTSVLLNNISKKEELSLDIVHDLKHNIISRIHPLNLVMYDHPTEPSVSFSKELQTDKSEHLVSIAGMSIQCHHVNSHLHIIQLFILLQNKRVLRYTIRLPLE